MVKLTELLSAMEEDVRELKSVEDQIRELERQRTSHINRINDAQKAIDVQLAEARKSAPLGTDWGITQRDSTHFERPRRSRPPEVAHEDS